MKHVLTLILIAAFQLLPALSAACTLPTLSGSNGVGSGNPPTVFVNQITGSGSSLLVRTSDGVTKSIIFGGSSGITASGTFTGTITRVQTSGNLMVFNGGAATITFTGATFVGSNAVWTVELTRIEAFSNGLGFSFIGWNGGVNYATSDAPLSGTCALATSGAMNGATAALSATAVDATSVQFFLDNVSVGTDSSPPFTASKTPVGLGNHALKATAIFANGAITQTISLFSSTHIVSSGRDHGCALQNGGLKCWGTNFYGQLGTGNTTDSYLPVTPIGMGSGVTSVSCGNDFTCAVVLGVTKCWGRNSVGQLGDGSTTDRSSPVTVGGVGAASGLSAGNGHTCAVVSGGVRCWGWNILGQLGNNTTNNSSVPVQVLGLTSGATMVSAGDVSSCAVVGTVAKCWGNNSHGELGTGNNNNSLVPIQVINLNGVSTVSTGGQTSCASTTSLAAKCWGENSYGQLGLGTHDNNYASHTSQTQVTGLTTGVQSVAVEHTSKHVCATMTNGSLRCWGLANDGELGDGVDSSRFESDVPVTVLTIASGVEISSGTDQSCAVDASHTWCWGSNTLGQLGDGTSVSTTSPHVVSGF